MLLGKSRQLFVLNVESKIRHRLAGIHFGLCSIVLCVVSLRDPLLDGTVSLHCALSQFDAEHMRGSCVRAAIKLMLESFSYTYIFFFTIPTYIYCLIFQPPK